MNDLVFHASVIRKQSVILLLKNTMHLFVSNF